MTFNDLAKRIKEEDKNKVIIYRDLNNGWTNINVKVEQSEIVITSDYLQPFSDEM